VFERVSTVKIVQRLAFELQTMYGQIMQKSLEHVHLSPFACIIHMVIIAKDTGIHALRQQ
jgi:hypothetical protein